MRPFQFLTLAITGLVAAGCASTPFDGQPTAGDLLRGISTPETPRLSRGQLGEEIQVAQNTPTARPVSLPSIPSTSSGADSIAPPPSLPAAPAAGPTGTQQASLKNDRSARASVRAWVNGRPIFEDEIWLELDMRHPGVRNLPDKATTAFNAALTNIIELEIAYQDAVKKLEKGNPTALGKLREMVDQEYDKQTRQIRKNIPDEQFAEIAPTFRRQLERQFIGMEYIRSRVYGEVARIGYLEILDEYNTHPEQYQKPATMKWQHIFIAAGTKDRPTVADARRVADHVLSQAIAGADFAELCKKFDDGDSKTRGGLGFGARAGEIQPPELEKALFGLQNGQVGPAFEVSTGVHLYRLVERDPGGQIPLNDTVQAQIRNKIRNQIFEKEFKRFVRELKSRAIVEIERGI